MLNTTHPNLMALGVGLAVTFAVSTAIAFIDHPQQAFAPSGTCGGCAKLFSPGTESGTGGTIGGGHEPAKAFAPGQISFGSASDAAPGHVKP